MRFEGKTNLLASLSPVQSSRLGLPADAAGHGLRDVDVRVVVLAGVLTDLERDGGE